jgi:hypothetical protein
MLEVTLGILAGAAAVFSFGMWAALGSRTEHNPPDEHQDRRRSSYISRSGTHGTSPTTEFHAHTGELKTGTSNR